MKCALALGLAIGVASTAGAQQAPAGAPGRGRGGDPNAEGPNALTPGDEITVTIVPAADGKSPVGLLSAITYQDGHTVRFRSPDE